MSQLANPVNIGQASVLVRNAVIRWRKGNTKAEKISQEIRSIFGEEKVDDYNLEFSEGPGNGGFSSKTGDGEDYKLMSSTFGDTVTPQIKKRTARFIITEDLQRFSKYPFVNRRLENVGGWLWNGYVLDLSHKFTFAFDTSYVDRDGETVSVVGGDGAAMVADTHTLNNGDTFDNKLTGRLSETTLEDAEDLGSAIVDHNGVLTFQTYNILATGPHANTRNMARRLYQQDRSLGTDLNDMNMYKGMYRQVTIPFLATTATGAPNSAKARFWFLISEEWAKENLVAAVADWPDVENPTRDNDNNNIQIKGKMRYDIFHLNSFGIIGSNAT